MTKKNPKKNRYQLFTIFCVVLGLLYGFALYHAIKSGNRFNSFLYGAVVVSWLLIAYYWLRQANKIKDAE